jgi:uncharacterized protein
VKFIERWQEKLAHPRRMSRRDWIKLSATSATVVGLGCLGHGFIVRDHVEVSRVDVRIANLPAAFAGLRIAHLSDIHHGPYTSLDYIHRCIEITNQLNPDLVALTGDFTFAGSRYIEPCAEALRSLRPRVGVYASLGNHDYYAGAGLVARALREAGLHLLVDAKERLESRGDKLWVVGVDDLYYGETDLHPLLRDVPRGEPRIVLGHQPDWIEEFAARNQHADLMLSGHTHGGQIRIPLLGAPQTPSAYGQRYTMGLVRRDAMQIYTTRGIGTVVVPSRFDCPPEIVLYTLHA